MPEPNSKEYTHTYDDGKSAIRYNDETMSGVNGWWNCVCDRCGKVW